ncbi:5-hydroxytryptamine receptor 1A-beta-like [Stylophora pistillata]|uniref:5-hydroxytryptamine receptor 1A-beta-like n=1 Tax=Stylophora pistillata TaxID=50429 RepID=UPI000C052CB2|nr:5-hydroxytryptamine receptor 1A-beta-like [Stylophora pistillata]
MWFQVISVSFLISLLNFRHIQLFLLVHVISVTGNLLVILAVIFDPNRNLRSRFNFLVANLAAADLIVGVYALPMSVEFHIRESMTRLPIASTPLQRDHARRIAYFLSCTASLLSLAALARDRFIAIKEPLKYRTEMNTKQAAMVSFFIWLVSSGLPFLYFQIGFLRYFFVFVNTAVVTTFIVLCVTNAKVSRHFKSQVKNCGALHEGEKNDSDRAKIRAIEWQKRITKTFLIMLALYISCFLPTLILVYVISFCANCNCAFIHLARDINYNLVMANSSMNPFVFAWRLERYRKAFVKILRCQRWVPSETMPSTSVQETRL